MVRAVAGDYLAAHRAGVAFYDARCDLRVDEAADVVVASPGGAPKDMNLYQAQKTLDNVAGAVRDGGVIVLVARCREGLGNAVFEEWMTGMRAPRDLVDRIRREFVLGGHKAAAIAALLERVDLHLVSELPDDLVRAMHMTPFDDVGAAVAAAVDSRRPGRAGPGDPARKPSDRAPGAPTGQEYSMSSPQDEVVPALGIPVENPLSSLPVTAQKILNAARKLLVEKGYEAVTLEKVAAEAGVNKASIRYNFGNKAGLVASVVDSVIHEEFIHGAETLATVPTDDRVRALVEGKRHLLAATDRLQGLFDILPARAAGRAPAPADLEQLPVVGRAEPATARPRVRRPRGVPGAVGRAGLADLGGRRRAGRAVAARARGLRRRPAAAGPRVPDRRGAAAAEGHGVCGRRRQVRPARRRGRRATTASLTVSRRCIRCIHLGG